MTTKSKVLRCAAAALAFALPAFAEDAYIESDGTTFINLGHCVGPKTKIELDFQMVEVSNGIRMLGSVGDASNPRCRFYVGTASGGTVCFSFTSAFRSPRQRRTAQKRAAISRKPSPTQGVIR